MNVELRSDGYYAVLMVPKDVRDLLGKFKYLQKLKAKNPKKASQEAAPIVLEWKREILKARNALSSPMSLMDKALALRDEILNSANSADKDMLELILSDEAERIEEKQGLTKAKIFYDVGVGLKTPLQPLYEEWSKKRLKNYAPKTAETYRKDTQLFINEFPYKEAITKRAVKAWVNGLVDSGVTLNTLRNRMLCGIRHFYNFLDGKGLVDPDIGNPLLNVLPREEKTKRQSANKGWLLMDPEEVAKIFEAIPPEDTQLQQVTLIAMYSGMRIEEICSLKISSVICTENILCFSVTDAKTRAGHRLVPVHPKLLSLVRRLEKISEDGFLVSGLTFNKYQNRSNAVGKRFGRLKDALGFKKKQVFHSIRKCVITQLERAMVPESVVADLVGHEKPNITYGLYSGGTALETLQKAIRKLNYPSVA